MCQVEPCQSLEAVFEDQRTNVNEYSSGDAHNLEHMKEIGIPIVFEAEDHCTLAAETVLAYLLYDAVCHQ